MATIAEEPYPLMAQLPPRKQEHVLSFACELAHPPAFPRTPLPPGTPGHVVASLRVSPEASAAIEQALEETGRIWPDEER
jgi:hypothetical protein